MQQDVVQLEIMCKQMYEGENTTRNEAEKVLVAFQNSLDALPKCQLLLDRGESSYSQLLAATTLTKLISKNAQGLSIQEIVDIRNYILNYLATRPNLEGFVTQALVTVLAKITKYGWFYCHKTEMVFRNIVEDVRKFLQVIWNFVATFASVRWECISSKRNCLVMIFVLFGALTIDIFHFYLVWFFVCVCCSLR